jgi:hypothetical protein
MDWMNAAISPVKDLVAFLGKKSESNDVHKKQLLRELRNNLIVFENAFTNNINADIIIDNLSNEAVKQALKDNFNFHKIRPGKITAKDILDERNKKYLGWTSEKLVDKIDEKIEELKTIKRLNNNSVQHAKNNITLMLGNLYFRMKLLADFIKSGK